MKAIKIFFRLIRFSKRFHTLSDVVHVLSCASLVPVAHALECIISNRIAGEPNDYKNEQNQREYAMNDSKPSKNVSASFKSAAEQKLVQALVLFVHFCLNIWILASAVKTLNNTESVQQNLHDNLSFLTPRPSW